MASSPSQRLRVEEAPAELAGLLGGSVDAGRFRAAIHLVRIGLYPDDEDVAVLDYTISKDLTDYLIVVNFDEQRRLASISMES